MKRSNPFSINGDFIGRERELALLNDSIKRGQSVVLYAPLGEGKTTLFNKCCSKYKYSKNYVVMSCNLMATGNMNDFTTCLINSMKPFTTEMANKSFIGFLKSIKPQLSIDFDSMIGTPSYNIAFCPEESETTLEQIKHYIESSSKQYILYIDEFQQIIHYPDNNAEALLQSFFSSVSNLVCVFSGSRNRMLKEMFITRMSSFYSKLTIIELSPIDCLDYAEFVVKQFKRNDVTIDEEIVEAVYNLLEGSTLYMQRLFSDLYSKVAPGDTITSEVIESELEAIVSENFSAYNFALMNYTARQKEYIVKLAHDIQPTGKAYAKVQAYFIKNEKISYKNQRYYINDKFLRVWLRKQFPLISNGESGSHLLECRVDSQDSISKEDRDCLSISLAYLTALEWSRSNERALLTQLKEVLTGSIPCPNSRRFHKIKKYFANRNEASLDSDMANEIKKYINEVLSQQQ